MAVEYHINRAREVALILFEAWNSEGIFGTKYMPEDWLPEGVEPGSSEHALFITLTIALDYMRDADQLWKACRDTYADSDTRYLFDPRSVVYSDIYKVQEDLQKYGVVRKHNRDTQTWIKICTTLTKFFDGRVESLLLKGGWSGPHIIRLIQGSTYRAGFPYLKGPKIAPLWIRMMKDNWNGHELINLEKVELPVDVHTGASTVMLGCITGEYKGSFGKFRRIVQNVWADACQGTNIYPLQLDEPLWTMSRLGCRSTRSMPCKYGNDCPTRRFCTGTRFDAYGDSQSNDEVMFHTGIW